LYNFNSIVIKNNSNKIWIRKKDQPKNENAGDKYMKSIKYAMDKDILKNAYDVLDQNKEKQIELSLQKQENEIQMKKMVQVLLKVDEKNK
jgi:hypothetical protein